MISPFKAYERNEEIDALAVAYLTRKYRLAFFFGDTYLFWVLAMLLFIAGYIATVIRNRRKAARMAMEESEEAAMPHDE